MKIYVFQFLQAICTIQGWLLRLWNAIAAIEQD